MEEAGKGTTPAVLKMTLAAFENEMLKKHLWLQARGQLKEAWRPFPGRYSSGSPCGAALGLVEAVLIESIKWLYTQTSVLCCADASQ